MLWCIALFLLKTSLVAAIPPVPEYQLGDVAEATVITPVPLRVMDPEETKRLREKALEEQQPVVRFYPKAVDEAETDLRAAFQSEREKFLAAVQQCYRKSKLNEATVNHVTFGQFLAWVRERNASFPCATNLARAWALGDSGERILAELVSKLRQAMGQYIQGDELALGSLEKVASALMFTGNSTEAIPDLDTVEKRSRKVPAHELYTLAEARKTLMQSFSPAEQPLGKFLAGFLKANCSFDPHLADRLHKKKAAELWATVNYEPGQAIVKTGESVDAKAKAALEALAEKRTAEQKRLASAREREQKVQAVKNGCLQAFAWLLLKLENAEPLDYALWGSLVGLTLVFILVRRHRQQAQRPAAPVPSNAAMAYTVILNPERNETIFLPAKQKTPPGKALEPVAQSEAKPADLVPHSLNDAQWQERAQEAEQRAKELLSMVRAGLAPHLAKELMNRLVQELIAQRSALLETQKVAGRELASIEARFTAISQQLQEQLTAYERRTQDLEGKLADKDQQNSELLKAMISTQRKLQSTQSGNTGD